MGFRVLAALMLINIYAHAYTRVIFQPDAACGNDALVASYWPDTPYGTHADFIACAWTNQGNPSNLRALVQFDLATIPAGAQIISATLELFHYASPNNVGHSNMSGPATCWLERITQPWNEMTVTWNNQPATTAVNQVSVPAPTNMSQDYSVDVTALVTDMHNDPANSYGFMLRLQNESYYRSLLFASSDMSNPAAHPKLTVVYTLDLQPDPGCWSSYLVVSTGPVSSSSGPDPIVVLPNVFTPNNDGVNDLFFADSVYYSVDELLIYDRWGAVVFRSRPGIPWDGRTTSGTPCSDGIYYYVFRYSSGSGRKTIAGFVTLIR